MSEADEPHHNDAHDPAAARFQARHEAHRRSMLACLANCETVLAAMQEHVRPGGLQATHPHADRCRLLLGMAGAQVIKARECLA